MLSVTEKPTLPCCAIIIIFALAINLYGINRRVMSQTEPYRALVAEEMMRSRNYWLPTLNGQPYLAKPPVFFWMICATSLFSGDVSPYSARMATVVSAIAIGLVIYLSALRYLGGRAAFFAAMIFLTSGEVLRKSAVAEIDINFTLWVTLALLFWYRAYENENKLSPWLLAYLFLGIAVLAKGPPALIFFFGTVVPFVLIKKRAGLLIKPINLAGVGLFIIIVAAWVVPVVGAVGASEFSSILFSETMQRSFNRARDAAEWRALWFYPARLLAGFMPWTPLIALFFRKSMFKGDRPREAFLLFCLINVISALVLFSALAGKALRYILPVFPFLACIGGAALEKLLSRKAAPDAAAAVSKGRIPALFAAVIAAMLILKIVYVHTYIPRYNKRRAYIMQAELVNKYIDSGKPIYTIGFDRPGLFYYIDAPVIRARRIPALIAQIKSGHSIKLLATTPELIELKQRPLNVKKLKSFDYRGSRVSIIELSRQTTDQFNPEK